MATSLGLLGVVYSDSFPETSAYLSASRAIFGFGNISNGTRVNILNIVNNTGFVITDTTGATVGLSRNFLAAASYGGDKAIFGFGTISNGTCVNYISYLSNLGVITSESSGTGTDRTQPAAASYGGDKAIFGYGTISNGTAVSITNLVSNTGVVASDVNSVGTTRSDLAAAGYGGDKAIFGYGYAANDPNFSGIVSMTNLVSNTGVVAAYVSGVGTARSSLAAAGYGGDKAIFGYGYTNSVQSMTNLVSNTGVVASDINSLGTARYGLAAASYGGDKAIFGYGTRVIGVQNLTNLVSNIGGVLADVTGVGTARTSLAAAGFAA